MTHDMTHEERCEALEERLRAAYADNPRKSNGMVAHYAKSHGVEKLADVPAEIVRGSLEWLERYGETGDARLAARYDMWLHYKGELFGALKRVLGAQALPRTRRALLETEYRQRLSAEYGARSWHELCHDTLRREAEALRREGFRRVLDLVCADGELEEVAYVIELPERAAPSARAEKLEAMELALRGLELDQSIVDAFLRAISLPYGDTPLAMPLHRIGAVTHTLAQPGARRWVSEFRKMKPKHASATVAVDPHAPFA